MTTTTDVAVVDATDRQTKMVSVLPYEYMNMQDRWRYAVALANARTLLPKGLLSGTPQETAGKVFLIMETGSMLGLHPMAAFQGIDVIEGKATITPRLFTALARRAGHKLREKVTGSIRGGDYEFTVTLIRADDPEEPISRSFSLEDAEQAGLCKIVGEPGAYRVEARSQTKNEPLPWEKYTKDLVQWRAYGRLMRAGAADVTMGVGYFPEELEVMVTEEGEVVRDMGAAEDAIIEEITKADDKAVLARIWGEHHSKAEDGGDPIPDELWTSRVAAEFASKLSTTTKDSRPPKDAKPGAPGNTGEPAIDDAPVPEPEAEDSNVEDAIIVEFGETEPSPAAAEQAAAVAQADMSEEEWERAELERAAAAGELPLDIP